MWQRFSGWVIAEPTTPEQAKAYLGLMMAAYPIVFTLASAGLTKAAVAACWATGSMDIWLYLQGKVRTRLPLSIPLGVVSLLGIASNTLITSLPLQL